MKTFGKWFEIKIFILVSLRGNMLWAQSCCQSVGVGEEDSQSWHRWRTSVKAAY